MSKGRKQPLGGDNDDSNILLPYQLDPRPSSSSFGLNVAQLVGIDKSLIDDTKVLAAYKRAKKKEKSGGKMEGRQNKCTYYKKKVLPGDTTISGHIFLFI